MSKNAYQMLYETMGRALVVSMMQEDENIDRALAEGRTYLLLEKFTNEDAKALSDSTKRMTAALGNIEQFLTKNNMKKSAKVMADKKKSLAAISPVEIAKMSMKGDTEGLKSKMTELNSAVTEAGNLAAAVTQTLINAGQNLKEVDFTEPGMGGDEYKSKTFADIEKDQTNSEAKKHILDIMKSVLDSFDTPDWQKSAVEKGMAAAKSDAGGFFGKIKSLFSSLAKKAQKEWRNPAFKAFKEDLKSQSVKSIIDMLADMQSAKKVLQTLSGQLAKKTTSATADVAPKPKGAGGKDETGKGSSAKGAKPSKAKIKADLQKAAAQAGAKDPQGVVDAVLTSDETSKLFSESMYTALSSASIPIHKQRLSSLLFEADDKKVNFATIKNVITAKAGEKVDAVAASIVSALKKANADVDDSDVPKSAKDAAAAAKESSPKEKEAGEEGKDDTKGKPSEKATAGLERVASDAAKNALGKTVLDAVKAFAIPYKKKPGVMASVDKLSASIRDALEKSSGDLTTSLSDAISAWFESLDQSVKDDIGKGDRFAALNKSFEDAIKKAVEDNLTMESMSRQKSLSRGQTILNESRWARLAGIKDEN